MIKKHDKIKFITQIICDDDLIEIARQAIENRLVEHRDDRLSMPNRANGLVIREKDGSLSSTIRLGPESAVKIGLFAIRDHIKNNKKCIPKNKETKK